MYIGFELKKIDESFFNDFKYFLNIGNRTLRKHKAIIRDTVDRFKNENGSLDGDMMQSNWFPQINADIFLSHSHADENLVIAFGGWLKEEFGLECFIDSCIWGYSENLQKLLDNKYSLDEDGKLIYRKVLEVSSHVHIMLNTALLQMIDNCECVIFINTPKSVRPRDVINKIVSPWIYSEIGMTKLVKKKTIDEYRVQKLYESRKEFSDFSIEYKLDTNHLMNLTINDLNHWEKIYPKKIGMITLSEHITINQKTKNNKFMKTALDYLYELKDSQII